MQVGVQEREDQWRTGTQSVAQGGQCPVWVDVGQGADGVRRVERLGLGEVCGHVSLCEFHVLNVRVGGDGAFVLGRGQLDSGDASAVGSREMHSVVAGPGADVQDAAAGDVAEDFSPWSDPLPGPGRPGHLDGDGWCVGAGQLALAIDLPGLGVDVLAGHGASSVGGMRVRCV